MQFSMRLAVATHVLLLIAAADSKKNTTSAALAESVNVNPVVIRRILGQLKQAGIVRLKPGVSGASLQRSVQDITLLDIFNAVEADEALFHFHEKPNPKCPIGRNITHLLSDELDVVREAMKETLDKTSLQSLIDKLNQEATDEIHLDC